MEDARRWMPLALALALGLTVAAPSVAAAGRPARTAVAPAQGPAPAGDPEQAFDSRRSAAAQRLLAARAGQGVAGAAQSTAALRAALGDEGVLTLDPLTATPRFVGRTDGFLTGPSTAPAREVALAYVTAHAGGLGLSAGLGDLRLMRDYVDIGGTHHLAWEQSAGGVALSGNDLQASVTADGRLVNLSGSPVAGPIIAPPAAAAIGEAAALAAARADARSAIRSAAGSAAAPAAFDGADSATAVLLQTADGTRRAWRTTIASRGNAYGFASVVDAETGQVLRRSSLVLHASALAFDNHPGARLGATQQLVDMTAKGWLPAGAARLSGNNAHAYADVDGNFSASSSEEVGPDAGGNWNYPVSTFNDQPLGCSARFPCTWISNLATGGFSWQANRSQAATQAFHFANTFHDHLAAAPVGFTEAAGNYQQVNASGEGRGGDPVEVHALLGANTLRVGGQLVGLPSAGNVNDAFTIPTGPDGQSAHIGLLLTHDPAGGADRFIAANYGDEADIVYHEYTHALQFRLLVDAQGNTTIADSYQSLAMAEGSADWYANDYLVTQGVRVDTAADGEIREGDYVTRGAGIRTQPMDCAVGSWWPACQGGTQAPSRAGRGGFTFGDLSRVSDVDDPHRDGEVWSETLWDLRRAIGSSVALGLVTRAMELSPAGPTFLEERNAILQADVVNFSGVHRRAIWSVFARRGMGYFAGMTQGAFPVSPDEAHDPSGELIVEDFQLPPVAGAPAVTVRGRAVDDQTGAPLEGVRISLATFPAERSAVTGSDGRYELTGVAPGSYRLIYAAAPQLGYDFTIGDPLRVFPGQRLAYRDWRLRRDWASVARGASVASFTGTDYTQFGCGPDAAIDRSYAGWSSDALDAGGNRFTPEIVIALPEPVDVSGFGLLPSETCGDDPTASTRDFRIETSTDGVRWRAAAAGTLAPENRYRLQDFAARGVARDVRYVRLTLLHTQIAQPCTVDPQQSGCYFADITELEVYGR